MDNKCKKKKSISLLIGLPLSFFILDWAECVIAEKKNLQAVLNKLDSGWFVLCQFCDFAYFFFIRNATPWCCKQTISTNNKKNEKQIKQIKQIQTAEDVTASIQLLTPNVNKLSIKDRKNWRLEFKSRGDSKWLRTTNGNKNWYQNCPKALKRTPLIYTSTGIVVIYDVRKGFGYIQDDITYELVFVSMHYVVSPGYRTLREGAKVRYQKRLFKLCCFIFIFCFFCFCLYTTYNTLVLHKKIQPFQNTKNTETHIQNTPSPKTHT